MMIFEDPLLDYIIVLTVFLAISFALGIMFGFKTAGSGDAIAVILVAMGSIILQAYMMPSEVNIPSWILYSTIGTGIGVGINFLAIKLLVDAELVALDNSHLVTFPLTLAGLLIAQYIYLANLLDSSSALSWILFSALGFAVALVIIALLSVPLDFSFDILATREEDYFAMVKWGLMGLILGICYTLSTSQVLSDLY